MLIGLLFWGESSNLTMTEYALVMMAVMSGSAFST